MCRILLTEGSRQFSDSSGGDPSLAFSPIQTVAPDDAKDPKR